MEVLQKADKLIIDFTDLERIDETALQKLKGIKTSAIAMGKSVEFIGLNENMTNRFEKFYTVV
jgi:anti-anti-sigma regulatory factor